MKLLKCVAVASLLIGMSGTAYAEGGHERVKQFNQDFRTEQARLWDSTSLQQADKQQVSQQQKRPRTESK
nr:hypothetical protein [uncultured Pseudomonas sp.]